ncbi:MAG TPA: hypothetical protein VN224_03165, partial [Xanthomonadales bacterium]|nr:hypothetical protein [Xanthomonadales bacterium]
MHERSRRAATSGRGVLCVELAAHRIRMRHQKLAVAAGRVEDPVLVAPERPPYKGCSNVGRREKLPMTLSPRHRSRFFGQAARRPLSALAGDRLLQRAVRSSNVRSARHTESPVAGALISLVDSRNLVVYHRRGLPPILLMDARMSMISRRVRVCRANFMLAAFAATIVPAAAQPVAPPSTVTRPASTADRIRRIESGELVD